MSLPVVAIVGRPNVGKSTLFNRLVGFRKAFVFDRPGVTRDRMYEEAEHGEHRFLVIDTGGLEPAPDSELLVAMRQQVLVAVEEANVIVFVVDAQLGFTPADMEVAELLRRSERPVVLAVNKVDGPRHEDLAADFWQVGVEELFTISAEHGRGTWELLEAVCAHLPEPAPVDDEAADEASLFDDEDDAEQAAYESSTEAARDAGLSGEDFADWFARLEAGELGPEEDEADDEATDEAADDAQAVSVAPVGAPLPDALRIAVIGRPNIGKSTLINRLLGEDRHVVHDAPGTTMDPIDSALEIDGRRYVLVDTAGVRRKTKIGDPLERSISLRSIRAIERCHVAMLVIDALEGITTQDARLIELVVDRGRALVLLVNKWDLTKDVEDVDARSVEFAMDSKLPHATWAPHLFISALTGKGVHRVLPMVDRVFESFNRRVPTSQLNRFLERAVHEHSPPQRHHHPVRLYYMTQARVRPPTFLFFSNTPDGIQPSYQRYLANRLRETWDFEGTPLRLHFKRRRKLGEGRSG